MGLNEFCATFTIFLGDMKPFRKTQLKLTIYAFIKQSG